MKEKLCYSSGDCAGQIYVTLCTFFLTGYYTDTVGIAASAVATMMFVTRIFDGTSDLFMGALIEKTHSRYGKVRPWILWSSPFMALGFIALFFVPESLGDTGKLIYAYVTYILLNCVIYTANGNAYNSLLSRMTFSIRDRVSCTSIRFILGNVMALAINMITAVLVGKIGWHALAVIYAVIMLVLLLICFWGCEEHIGKRLDESDKERKGKAERVPLKKAFAALLHNKYFYLQTLLMTSLYISVMFTGTMTYYFCNSVLHDLSLMAPISMAYTLPVLLGSFLNPRLVERIGKQKTLIAAFALVILGRILVGLADVALVPIMIGCALHGFALGFIYADVFAMTSDVVDYGEWKFGIRSEGLVTCCVMIGMKVGLGIGGALVGILLAVSGYQGLAAMQAPEALAAIKFGFGYICAAFALVSLLISLFMNLDNLVHRIQEDLIRKYS